MFRIGMAHDKVLRAGNLHALHILTCQVNHQRVRHPRVIIGVERQRNMSDNPFDIGAGPALELKAADQRLPGGEFHAVTCQDISLSRLLAEQVAHRAAK